MTAGAVLAPTISAIRTKENSKPYNYIDTKTAIEIRCDTPNVEIYYTINGSPPNPFPWFGCDNKTLKYCHPLLPEEGKCVIKAIAVDMLKNRESFVVTKSFYIEKVVDSVDDLTAKSDIKEAEITPAASNLENHKSNEEKDYEDKDVDEREIASTESDEDDFSASGFNSPSRNSDGSENSASDSPFIDRITAELENVNARNPSTTSEEAEFNEPQIGNTIGRLMDSLKCPKCSYSNHATPSAKFCSLCGNKLVNQMSLIVTLPSLQQMERCSKCFCNVPHDVPYCIICETSFTDTNHVTFNKFIDSKVCSDCSTLNSSRSVSCTLCQNTLPKQSLQSTANPVLLPTIINTTRNFIKCEECGRVNCCQARYCDWCGKVLTANEELILECPQCFNRNQSMASFCQHCGYPLQPPINVDVNARLVKKTCDESVLAQPKIHQKSTMTSPWNISESKSIQTADTVSCLSQKWQKSIGKMRNIESIMENYCKQSGATSPGKGYWRQQVEHVAGHLKTAAYNDSNFRSQISKAKLSNLISTNVEEGNDEFSLSLKFALVSPSGQEKKKPTSNSDQTPSPIPKNLPPMPDKIGKRKEKLEEVDLIKLMHKSNTALQLKQLLNKCTNQSKNVCSLSLEALLSWSIRINQEEMIPLLIEAGCDWKVMNSEGNPPLHEAILLRERGLGAVKQLLKCGVDPELVNKNGQTAYEIAKATNNQAVVKLLSSHLGKNMLNEIVKSELKILI